MTRGNAVMERAGYIPASRVAEALDKSLMSIHRMVEAGDIEGITEGRVLFIKWSSLVAHYTDNQPMLDAVGLLAPEKGKKRKT